MIARSLVIAFIAFLSAVGCAETAVTTPETSPSVTEAAVSSTEEGPSSGAQLAEEGAPGDDTLPDSTTNGDVSSTSEATSTSATTSTPEVTSTTSDATTTSSTVPEEPCRDPAPLPAEAADGRMATLHTMITGLATATRAFGDIVVNLPAFESDWAAAPEPAGALYLVLARLYRLTAVTEQFLVEDGGAFTPGDGWRFPEPPPLLAPLADPWLLVRDYQAITLPGLLTATDRGTAMNVVDSGELCRVVDGFTRALEDALGSSG